MVNNIEKNTELKRIISDYVEQKTKKCARIEDIEDIFIEEFPEFLIKLAEENWINGYSQALQDTEFIQKNQKNIDEPGSIT
jgi:hypothetical protein